MNKLQEKVSSTKDIQGTNYSLKSFLFVPTIPTCIKINKARETQLSFFSSSSESRIKIINNYERITRGHITYAIAAPSSNRIASFPKTKLTWQLLKF